MPMLERQISLGEMLRPYPADEMVSYLVGTAINAPRN